MKTVINKTKNTIIAYNVVYAKNFWLRSIGLMFRKKLVNLGGMLFPNAPFLHTCFMRMPIDIFFLDREKKVIKIIKGVPAWRLACCHKACFSLELPVNTQAPIAIALGDQLAF